MSQQAKSGLENWSWDATDEKAVTTIRILSAEMVEAAKSGHPGMPMGAACLTYVLWRDFYQFDPKSPRWMNRDRFVLSAGHGSALLYSMLHLTGFEVSLEQIKRFRQIDSPCAGHPEFGHLPGIETTTGPLGQGMAVAVGMAMAEAFGAARFAVGGKPLLDHYTYCIVGDGCLMEGITSEAASLAGHLQLGKLITLYDSNRISIDGSTDLAFTEDVAKRFEAYGWQVLACDGNDPKAVATALTQARAETKKPSLLICRTHIGFGAPKKQDSADSHGAPLGAEELAGAKKNLHWTEDQAFQIPPAVGQRMREFAKRGQAKHEAWRNHWQAFRSQDPSQATLLEGLTRGEMPSGWATSLPTFTPADKPIATRAASGKVMQAIANTFPTFWGGSADLAESNSTHLKEGGDFQSSQKTGRNIRFGVREHAMGAVLNGLAHSDWVLPFGGTFLIFSDYMRPSIRLAALMGLPVTYVFTHDSIFLGEDGPTHQPIEQLASLRAIPNLRVIRPADARETVAAWRYALEERRVGPQGTPVALALSRQALPIHPGTKEVPSQGLSQGGYVVKSEVGPHAVTLLATGSEVDLAIQVAGLLEAEGHGTRVVSMPCRELFLRLTPTAQQGVLGDQALRVVVEAGIQQGWEGLLGSRGLFVGMDRFGASAPAKDLAKHFGFTPEMIAEKVRGRLAR